MWVRAAARKSGSKVLCVACKEEEVGLKEKEKEKGKQDGDERVYCYYRRVRVAVLERQYIVALEEEDGEEKVMVAWIK